jgi:hypothetical protein
MYPLNFCSQREPTAPSITRWSHESVTEMTCERASTRAALRLVSDTSGAERQPVGAATASTVAAALIHRARIWRTQRKDVRTCPSRGEGGGGGGLLAGKVRLGPNLRLVVSRPVSASLLHDDLLQAAMRSACAGRRGTRCAHRPGDHSPSGPFGTRGCCCAMPQSEAPS